MCYIFKHFLMATLLVPLLRKNRTEKKSGIVSCGKTMQTLDALETFIGKIVSYIC